MGGLAYAVEGRGEAQPPRILPLPTRDGQASRPNEKRMEGFLEGRRPSAPPRRKATAYVL